MDDNDDADLGQDLRGRLLVAIPLLAGLVLVNRRELSRPGRGWSS